MSVLACIFILPILFYCWFTTLVSAGAEYVIHCWQRCRASVQQMVQRISLSCSRAVSFSRNCSFPLCCGGDATYTPDNKDQVPTEDSDSSSSSSSSAKVPAESRSPPRSLGSWVRIWESTRAPSSTKSNPSSTVKSKASSSSSSSSPERCARPQPSPPPPGPSPFPPEVQLYLYNRLPVRRPRAVETIRLHFARLPLVYQDLADRCLAQAASDTSSPGPVRDRRHRMWVLAVRLAKRYRGFNVVLSDRFLKSVLVRHAHVRRPSKFWEKVLSEVEKANASWSLTRLWIALCVLQSSLVLVISRLLSPTAQAALTFTHSAAYVWSAKTHWDMVHARYMTMKADEQNLHDLIGGLQ